MSSIIWMLATCPTPQTWICGGSCSRALERLRSRGWYPQRGESRSPCSRALWSPALLQLGLSHSVGPWTLVQKWPARAAGPCESACAAAAGSEPFGGSVDPGAEVAHFFHVLVSRVVAVLNFVGCELKNNKNNSSSVY